MKIYVYLILFLAFLSFENCKKSKEDKNDKLKETLLYIFSSPTAIADQYSKIFYMNPAFLANSTRDYNLFYEASATSASSTKKKLLIIHGWQSADRNVTTIPDVSLLKRRLAEDIWKDMLNTEFLGNALARGYEIYFYTYLTSTNLSENTTRLKKSLDTVFGSETGTLVIYAHSMGGLLARGAIYEYSSTPAFVSRVLTVGTPYHGSPWASSNFQAANGILGDLANFLTSSDGGKNLAWDNYDNSLPGASNSYLATMNAKSGRDSLIYAFYGQLDKSGTSYAGSDRTLLTACASLSDTFSPSDCLVPQRSAIGTGLSLGKTINLGFFHHTDINLREINLRNTIISELP